jgi:hypothetical protein
MSSCRVQTSLPKFGPVDKPSVECDNLLEQPPFTVMIPCQSLVGLGNYRRMLAGRMAVVVLHSEVFEAEAAQAP